MTRLPLIAAIVAGVLMILSLTWQGWQFSEGEQQRQTQRAVREEPASAPSTVNRNDQALTAVNLFGNPEQKDKAQQTDTENLPETNLRLVLRGVMAGDENSAASALIEDSNNKTEAYLIEDELPGDATLKSVYPHRVVIQRNGALENLYFPEAKDGESIRVTSAGQPQRSSGSSQSSRGSQRQPSQRQSSGQSAQSSTARQEQIRNRLESLRDRLRNNSN